VTNRLCRKWITRINPITGRPEEIMATVNATNLYTNTEPDADAEDLARPSQNYRPAFSARVCCRAAVRK
jgi:hypothetical protein